MRHRQRVRTHVLGYAIERHESHDQDGAASARYDVRCPETGNVLAQLQSLRMARRFVVAQELNEFLARSRGEPSSMDKSAA